MRIGRISRVIFVSSVLAWAFPATGQESLYAGVGLGQSQIEHGPLDESETGYKLFAGYRFSEGAMPLDSTFGVELGLVDFGSVNATAFGEVVNLDVDGLELYATVDRPFGDRWSVIGKIGAISWDRAFRVSDQGGSTDGSDLAAGIGVEWRTGSDALSIRGEIEGYDFLDGVWLYAVSAIYRFGGN